MTDERPIRILLTLYDGRWTACCLDYLLFARERTKREALAALQKSMLASIDLACEDGRVPFSRKIEPGKEMKSDYSAGVTIGRGTVEDFGIKSAETPYSSREVEQALAGARRLGEKLLNARRIDPVKWRRPFTI